MNLRKIKVLNILLGVIAASHLFAQKETAYNLQFNTDKFVVQALTLNGKTFKVRAFEKIVYVQNPVDTEHQIMNVYVPEEYFEGKSVNGYTATTAPIFFPNSIGGYMPASPASALNNGRGGFTGGPPPGALAPPKGNQNPNDSQNGRPPMDSGTRRPIAPGNERTSAIVVALSKGYVVASAGARGRTSKNANGTYTGKAPAVIVDLKAAVRYLKYNNKKMPGDANKIISNGTSAGGALSALLGATGNNKDYEPYLKALGAANATDDIFAVSAYCPITNLDHADMAYEWQFNGVNNYKKISIQALDYNVKRTETADSLSKQQTAVSLQLKQSFPQYVNSLNLKDKNGKLLTLDANGNGNFKNFVKSYVIASAQKALNAGTDLSSLPWVKTEAGNITDLDFEAYVKYMERMKTPPAFDALDLSTGENQLFGNATVDKHHFTGFSADYSTVEAVRAEEPVVRMMNPMYYIGQPNTKTAAFWRIRHGTKDRDTGLSIPVILGTYLQNKGYNVNLELPWDVPHSGDYDLDELFQWIESVCR